MQTLKIKGECYLSLKAKLSTMQRFIIVHSILYYMKDTSVISDKEFDDVARELVKLKKQNPEEYKKTDYFYCMKDFDGTTGFDLFDKLSMSDKMYLTCVADNVLKEYKGGNQNGKRSS